jgi:hypothetical protein
MTTPEIDPTLTPAKPRRARRPREGVEALVERLCPNWMELDEPDRDELLGEVTSTFRAYGYHANNRDYEFTDHHLERWEERAALAVPLDRASLEAWSTAEFHADLTDVEFAELTALASVPGVWMERVMAGAGIENCGVIRRGGVRVRRRVLGRVQRLLITPGETSWYQEIDLTSRGF